jgi:mRNA-degrading endonuclease toxin of MazEF toxin-antitoxin module
LNRGDIWLCDLNPASGHEQAGKRCVLVISPRELNKVTGVPLIAPITTGGGFARDQGFAVTLTGAGTRTTGVVLCHQVRVLDFRARGAKFVERVPDEVVDEVIAKVQTLLE